MRRDDRRKKIEEMRLEVTSILRSRSMHEGIWRSAFNGDGYEFVDVREFIPGDKTKKIHKPSFLKTGELFVREDRTSRQLKVFLFIDVSSSMQTEFAEDVLDAAATIITSAAQYWGAPVGGLLFDETVHTIIAPSYDKEQLTRILEKAWEAQKSFKGSRRKTDFKEAFSYLAHIPLRSLVFFLSDFLGLEKGDSETAKALYSFARQYDIAPVVIDNTKVWETLPRGFYEVRVGDLEEGGDSTLFLTPGSIDEIRRTHRERKEKIIALFRRSSVSSVFLDTGEPKACLMKFTEYFRQKIQYRKW